MPEGDGEALVDACCSALSEQGAGRPSARQQTRDVALRVLAERHPELHEHSGAVATLARAVGERLGLDEAEIDDLERAGELHDIGKIAIPDAVLHKGADLSPEEWELMRKHTIIGQRVLDAAPALRPVANLIRSTHERWDGEGYPDRLAGRDIPLGSRAIFICDAYHAMTEDRSYRSAMSREEALEELRRGAGTQFDPDLVRAFVDKVVPALDQSPAPVRKGVVSN
jgi:two-component system, cell cycle response regulator